MVLMRRHDDDICEVIVQAAVPNHATHAHDVATGLRADSAQGACQCPCNRLRITRLPADRRMGWRYLSTVG